MSYEAVMESAYYWGVGLANIITALQSELVILNGPLIAEYPNYYVKTVEAAKRICLKMRLFRASSDVLIPPAGRY